MTDDKWDKCYYAIMSVLVGLYLAVAVLLILYDVE